MPQKPTNNLFKVHKLNALGFSRAKDLAKGFSDLADLIDQFAPESGREKSIAMTHLETACFFAKKSLAQREENQEKV